MSNQLIGVSPPPLGQALDSKVDLKKDFKETSSEQYKNDFEKALKEKLAAKEDKKADVDPPKEMKLKKDDNELEVDREEKKTSGGTKKRMNEKVDDQIVSMIMASNESEVEIPESQITDLASIEESQPKAQTSFAFPPQAVETKAIAKNPLLPQMPEMENAIAPAVVPTFVVSQTELSEKSLPPELMQKLQTLQQPVPNEESAEVPAFQPEAKVLMPAPQQQVASEVQQIRNTYDATQVQPADVPVEKDEPVFQPQILPEQPVIEALQPSIVVPQKAISIEQDAVSELAQKIKALETPSAAASGEVVQQVAPKAMSEAPAVALVAAPIVAAMVKSNSSLEENFDLEKDLNDEVGFEPSHDVAQPKQQEADLKPVSLKAQQFEKSVYDQLQMQKMDQRPPTAALQSHPEKFAAKESVKSDDTDLKSLKADAVNPNEMQHVGQTQSEFKNHLATPTFAGSEQHRAQLLEQNHEKNIQEVMNQAQYLVKKGGGEMKVSMSPDGLSEVQLKVMLQDGKVNIEMQTHDKNVKKLMEDSLTELKSGLAAQNLSVEHVKINSVSATNTDNSAQFQSNWNQSGGEHQQREYWNQFQDNLNQRQNFSRRSNYGASSGNSSVGETAASAASSNERVAAAPRTYGGTKGSQINWVA